MWLHRQVRTRDNRDVGVGIRELRSRLSHYVRAVRAGDEVTVTDHGKAVARLVPLEGRRPLDRLIAEGIVTPATSPKVRLIRSRVTCSGTVSDLVAEQRR